MSEAQRERWADCEGYTFGMSVSSSRSTGQHSPLVFYTSSPRSSTEDSIATHDNGVFEASTRDPSVYNGLYDDAENNSGVLSNFSGQESSGTPTVCSQSSGKNKIRNKRVTRAELRTGGDSIVSSSGFIPRDVVLDDIHTEYGHMVPRGGATRNGNAGHLDDDSLEQSCLEQTSIGTSLHGTGECKPCLFMMSAIGCFRGTDCNFCHALSGHKRASKSKRDRIKRVVERSKHEMPLSR